MLTADITLDGLSEVSARPAALAGLSDSVQVLLLARAEEGKDRLARATNVATGAAQAGWEVEVLDATTVAIVNRVANRGYSYPAGLVTGTGGRAQPTTGFSGTHRADWPGMTPSRTLHPAWEAEVLTGFTLPATLLGGLP
jgi:hypothetical protein